MEQQAIGLIETIGYTTAVSAADAALKAANVSLEAVEKVIGVGGMLGVTIHLGGDVAAVKSAVEAGSNEAERVGKLVSSHVIPRAHQEVLGKLVTSWSSVMKPAAGEAQNVSAETQSEETPGSAESSQVQTTPERAAKRQSSSAADKGKFTGEAEQVAKDTK
ncbi:Propanediol utilization protein PduA [compost metagenome]